MTAWPTFRLGEALELAYGKGLAKRQRNEAGAIPVYGSNGIAGWHTEALIEGPVVIIGRKGSAGAVQLVNGPCYPIDTTYFVKPRAGFDFEPIFLFYLLKKLDLSRLKTATGVPGLTRDDAYRERIVVPPLSEQRRIVDILSRAEGIVRLRREAEKKAAELIPALFIEMFGDPAVNPKGWTTTPLGEQLDSADYGCSTKATGNETDLPILRMGNVTYEGDLNLNDLKYVVLSNDEIGRYSLRDGDILFNRTNSKELVGKTGLWNGAFSAAAASYFIRLRVKRTIFAPHFLWAFLNTRHMKRVLFETARGAIGQSNINSKELKAFRVPLPPLELQHQFAQRVEAIRALQAQQAAATAKAQASFDALLAQAFPA